MRSTRPLLLAVAVCLALASQIGPAPAIGAGSDATAATAGRWPGNQPGKVVLGMSCGSVCRQKAAELGQPYGVHRQFAGWGHWARLAHDIRLDHAAHRLPWVSIKPPQHGAAGWRAIADGSHDADLVRLAATLKANDSAPILFTFNHEPSNDGTEAQGKLWAQAYCHVHDLLKSHGALANVADPPILGDWLFNASNKSQDADDWVTHAVLARAPFLGIDMYENDGAGTFATRIPDILRWMAARGFPDKMVGIGEMGSSNFYHRTTADRWMTASLGWAVNHPAEVGVVSYFNSTANSRSGVHWPLDESHTKLMIFRRFLDNPHVRS